MAYLVRVEWSGVEELVVARNAEEARAEFVRRNALPGFLLVTVVGL